MKKEELEAQISYYSSKYYMGEPEITDEQFDMLVDKLRSIDPTSKILKTGWGFEINGDKVKHKYSHIGSLDKTKNYIDIPDRFKQKTVYISPKLDGLSAVAYYENGQLVKGVTRGNGIYGKDITEKLYKILGNRIFDKTFTGAVRGELIISNKNWILLQQKYTNLIAPRNFAAGIINRKEIDEDIQFIDLVVYKVVGQENKQIFKNREEMLQWLKTNFTHCIPIYYYPVLNQSSWDTYHQATFDDFLNMGYGLDGLVLTSPDIVYDSATNGYLFDEVAFKFPAETTTTTIKYIEWELSRTQRLIPVAVVEPVELSGAIVERATCNNAQWVRDMELGVGAEVEITRSNEIIPQILSVLQVADKSLPKYCPKCGAALIWDGVDLKCNNSQCPNIELSDLQQWCENIGETDGLQWTLMKQYLDMYGVTNINTLYTKRDFILNDLNTRKLSLTEIKVQEFFDKLYNQKVPMEKALVALNIPRLGDKTSKLLAKEPQLVLDYWYNTYLDIYRPEGYVSAFKNYVGAKLLDVVKEATTQSLIDNRVKFLNLLYLSSDINKWNLDRIVYEDVKDNSKIKYIAVTGALQKMKRKDFEAYISKYGYELTSNLKKCEYLVTNTPNSGSSKNKDAQKYGVMILTEEEFLNSLGQ
jgi:DNA ligase (NAD+)